MKKILFLLLFGATLLSNLRAQELTLVADSWMPYNGESGARNPGLLIEIAKAIFNDYGFAVHYKNMDWAQAIRETREGKYDGIVGTFKTDAPDFVFPNIEQALCENRFYALKDSPWIFVGLPSLEKIRIGIIDGYAYGQIDSYIAQYRGDSRRIVVSNNLTTNIEHLRNRKIDAFVEENSVMSWFLQDKPYRNEIRDAGFVKREKLYIAFSPKRSTSKRYAWFMTEGMKKIRESGTLDRILSKYSQADWKPLPPPPETVEADPKKEKGKEKPEAPKGH